MTMARRRLVDVGITRYYHCISRCVRRAFLCGNGFEHRKAWLEARLELLAGQFAISVCGFAILDNHLHLLCRLDPVVADGWSDEEVVRRWMTIYPPSRLDLNDPATVQTWVDHQCRDAARVARYRERLTDLGWLMKALKEPLARLANREEDCTGTFWEARYKSIAILDEQALLATCAYIDLNPLAAGISTTPEAGEYTSIKQRVDHARRNGAVETLRSANQARSVIAARIEGDVEQSHWLCPLQDRRVLRGTRSSRPSAAWPIAEKAKVFHRQHSRHPAVADTCHSLRSPNTMREGMLPGFSLSSYLELVDWTARLCRPGKARLSQEVAGVMDRLGTSAEYWQAHMRNLFAKTRWIGCYAATRAEALKAVALRRGVHHVDNALGAAALA